jgi:hypothetical protein
MDEPQRRPRRQDASALEHVGRLRRGRFLQAGQLGRVTQLRVSIEYRDRVREPRRRRVEALEAAEDRLRYRARPERSHLRRGRG